jgi:hypothetical protein
MKIFKVLSVIMVAGLLFCGCKGQGPQESQMPEAPTPLGAGAEIPADLDIGASHTTPQVAEAIEAGSIEKAKDGLTVEEIFTKKAELGGKTVTIRGKVVKFSPQIMGVNWIHLQDGTGSGVEGTNDLTVTTQATVDVNSTVVVSGVVTLDKDFGAGYKYSVIIEEAKVTAE